MLAGSVVVVVIMVLVMVWMVEWQHDNTIDQPNKCRSLGCEIS